MRYTDTVPGTGTCIYCTVLYYSYTIVNSMLASFVYECLRRSPGVEATYTTAVRLRSTRESLYFNLYDAREAPNTIALGPTQIFAYVSTPDISVFVLTKQFIN